VAGISVPERVASLGRRLTSQKRGSLIPRPTRHKSCGHMALAAMMVVRAPTLHTTRTGTLSSLHRRIVRVAIRTTQLTSRYPSALSASAACCSGRTSRQTLVRRTRKPSGTVLMWRSSLRATMAQQAVKWEATAATAVGAALRFLRHHPLLAATAALALLPLAGVRLSGPSTAPGLPPARPARRLRTARMVDRAGARRTARKLLFVATHASLAARAHNLRPRYRCRHRRVCCRMLLLPLRRRRLHRHLRRLRAAASTVHLPARHFDRQA